MRRIAIIATTLIMATSIAGCSKNIDGKSVNSEVTKKTTKITSEEAKNNDGTSVNTEIIDDFLHGSSYKDLLKEDSWTVGIEEGVKLREPLQGKSGVIPQTPSDEEFEKKPIAKVEDVKILEDAGKPADSTSEITTDTSVKSADGVKKAITEVVNETDKNLAASVLPEPLMFLYNTKSYVRNDLIDNGYLQLYSAQTGSTQAESYLKRLRIKNEALEHKNYQIRELFKDDAELISDWSDCFKQLMGAQKTSEKMTDSQSLMAYSKEIDLEALYTTYNKFESRANKHLVGFVPYIGEKSTTNNTITTQSEVDKDTKKQQEGE